jgi:hypothetical protein
MQRILSISISPALLAGVCHALSRLAGRMSVFIGVQPFNRPARQCPHAGRRLRPAAMYKRADMQVRLQKDEGDG